MYSKKYCLVLGLLFAGSIAFAQQKGTVVEIPFGNMDSWVKRSVKDSKIIGGETHTLYEIATPRTITELNVPYIQPENSPWATSNVLADVGVVKGSATVSPEPRNGGYCARLETKLEKVKVLGMFNMNVIAAGSIYLGSMKEPIKSTSTALANINRGIKVTGFPQKVIFDYKYYSAGDRYYANGFGSPKKVEGANVAEVVVLLQRRWEDATGKVFANRIGTSTVRFGDTGGKWIDGYELEILMGDITKLPIFKPNMGLMNDKTEYDNRHYVLNSKGESVPIIEMGWGKPGEQPTHIYLMFSSSQNGAYVGAPGSVLWIDNVKIGY